MKKIICSHLKFLGHHFLTKTLKSIPFVFLLILLYSCSNKKSNIEQKELSFHNNDSIILNKFIESITQSSPKINKSIIDSSNIRDFKNYYKDLSDTFKYEIKYDLSKITPKICVNDNVITIDYSSDDFIKLFVLKDKVIFSFHREIGNNGMSFIYDFAKQKSTSFYFIDSVAIDAAFVNREKYKFDEKNPGHYWQRGKWNFKSDNIIWGKWEN